jgi:hypothetical protein
MNAAATPRIGYVVNEFPQVGDERLVGELLELERCGVDLTVFSMRRPDSCRQSPLQARLQARIAYLPTRAAVRDRASWITSQVQDIEHLHAYSAQQSTAITCDIADMTGLSYSFSVEASDLGPGGVRRRDLRARAERAQFIVTRSAASMDIVADLCDENVAHKCHCLYHGIDFSALPLITHLRRAETVLAVAGTYGHDGIDDLLLAMNAVRRKGRSTELTIIATEHRHAALLTEIDQAHLADSVQVVAMPTESALFALMQRHTLLVAPWRATSEPTDVPQVILQGIAAGLPVVASELPGISEAVEDGWTGRLIPPGDAAWLAGAIETLLDNARLRHRMARLARQRLERDFSRPRNGSALARLFAHTATEQRWSSRVSGIRGAAGTWNRKGSGSCGR